VTTSFDLLESWDSATFARIQPLAETPSFRSCLGGSDALLSASVSAWKASCTSMAQRDRATPRRCLCSFSRGPLRHAAAPVVRQYCARDEAPTSFDVRQYLEASDDTAAAGGA